MIQLDAYNISFMLMDIWRKYAMRQSGTPGKLGEVPVYVEINGTLARVIEVVEADNKVILKTE